MNKPFLFIDTPRAGKHNHRFIIPTNYKDGDSLLSQFADTARQQAEAKAKELTEAKAKELTEAKAKELTEAKANELTEAKANELTEAKANELTEAKANELTEAKANELTEAKANELTEAKANELTEAKANELTEAKAKELTEAKANELTEAKANELTEAKANELTEAKANELTEAKANELTEAKANELTEAKANELTEAKANELTEAKANELTEAKANELTEAKANELTEAKANELTEAKANELTEAKANELTEAKANELTEAKVNELTEAKVNELTEAKVNEAPKPAEAESADTIISTKGIYFLAASKKASQKSGGRIGWEQLILANVEVKHLSATQMTDINSFLKQRLIEVEKLVVETIDWNKTTPMVIQRPELNQWLQELEQRLGMTIPTMPQEFKSQIKTKPASKRRWFIEPYTLGIGGAVVIGGLGIAYNNQLYHQQKDRRIEKSQPTYQEQQDKAKLEAAKKQAQRLISAIGGNEKDVRKELAPFAIPNKDAKTVSDTWKNGLGNLIPDSGTWSISIFFQNVDGNAVTTGLWGTNIEQLQIAVTKEDSLQPLVQCRIAIRNLMGVTGEVYTPFFKAEDFGNAPVPDVVMKRKITDFAENNKKDIEKQRGCKIRPESNESLLNWINECFKFTGDNALQKIKDVDTACGAVKFVTEPIPSIRQTK